MTGTIQLSSLGQLTIDKDLAVSGPGADLLTIRAYDPTPFPSDPFQPFAGDGSRLFRIDDSTPSNVSVTLIGLRMTGGDIGKNFFDAYGGAIFNKEALAIDKCEIVGNSAFSGGGIYSEFGSLEISKSTISDKMAIGGEVSGGAGIAMFFGNLDIRESTISSNQAYLGDGGGVWTQYTDATITSSTISGNSAGYNGGGIFHQSYPDSVPFNVVFCTIVDNQAASSGFGGNGGGINNSLGTVPVALSHTIVAGNHSGSMENDVLGAVSLEFSLLGNNTDSIISDHGGNLIGTSAMPIDPLLAPLSDNGGPTRTRALLLGSPAINAGNSSLIAGVDGVPQFDQRGMPYDRKAGILDIGAYEFQGWVVDTLRDESDGDYSPGDFSLREAIGLANLSPIQKNISFAPDLTASGPATILLLLGEIVIANSLVINGPGDDLLTVDASGSDPMPNVNDGHGSRVFNVDDNNLLRMADVSVSGLSITGGDVGGVGGGIRNAENLTIVGCIISGNYAVSLGGGIESYGTLSLSYCTINENVTDNLGGGVYISGNHLSVSHSTISNNVAGASGGGMYANYANTTISDSEIQHNSAAYRGGGLFWDFEAVGVLTISNTHFVDNSAGSEGGGFFNRGYGSYSNSTLINDVFEDNEAGADGGAIYNIAQLSIDGGSISENNAGGDGGGIFSRVMLGAFGVTVSSNSAAGSGGGIYSLGYLTIDRTTVKGNNALVGGGVFHSMGALAITGSTISGNLARPTGRISTYGGGLWHDQGALTIISSTISGNTALAGGGIYLADSVPASSFSHTTIVFNTASGERGGGIAMSSTAGLVLDHMIVAKNVGFAGAADDLWGTLTAEWTLIGTSTGATVTGGNNLLNRDPLLGPRADLGGPTQTHAPLIGSPVIDAGDPSFDPNGFQPPLSDDQRGAGFGRVRDGDGSSGARIDIGAFELQQPYSVPALLGDYNLNQRVDAADYVMWRKTSGTTNISAYSGADGNGSGTVDDNDYIVWRSRFGETTISAARGVIAVTVEQISPLPESRSKANQLVDILTTNHGTIYPVWRDDRPVVKAQGCVDRRSVVDLIESDSAITASSKDALAEWFSSQQPRQHPGPFVDAAVYGEAERDEFNDVASLEMLDDAFARV